MKATTILVFTFSLLLSGCADLPNSSSDNEITDEMTLDSSIKIWTGPNQYIVILPEGNTLPATATHSLLSNQDQSLTAYFFKEDGQELNQNNLIGEFWFSQFKDSRNPSEIKLEIIAESNREVKINAKDVETGVEKTMIFVDTKDGINNLEQYLAEKNSLLKASGGAVNYVIFQLKNGYFVQLAAGKDEEQVRCEASISNGGSDGNFELTTLPKDKLYHLEKLGWSPPEFGEFNYFRWDSIGSNNSLDHIAKNFTNTIKEVYDGSNVVHTTINLEKNQFE